MIALSLCVHQPLCKCCSSWTEVQIPLAKAEDAKRGMETGREGTVFTRESGTLARRSPLSALGQPWGDIL